MRPSEEKLMEKVWQSVTNVNCHDKEHNRKKSTTNQFFDMVGDAWCKTEQQDY